jgi:hypothetical protein
MLDVLRPLVYRFVEVTVAPVERDGACWKWFAKENNEVAARSTALSWGGYTWMVDASAEPRSTRDRANDDIIQSLRQMQCGDRKRTDCLCG